jgi:hypothetical protein
MFLGVHLPGLVRDGRAGRLGGRPPAGRGGPQVVLDEPPLQGALRGDGRRGHPLEQMHPDQAGPPGRVLAAQPQGGLDGGRGLVRGGGGPAVGRHQAGEARAPEPRQEPADGRAREPE